MSQDPKHQPQHLAGQSISQMVAKILPWVLKHRNSTIILGIEEAVWEQDITPQLAHDLSMVASLPCQIYVVAGQGHRQEPVHPDTTATMLSQWQKRFSLLARYWQRSQFGPGVQILTGPLVTSQPLGVIDGIDTLQAGKTRSVQPLDTGSQPCVICLPPVAMSASGEQYALNQADQCFALAQATGAGKIVLMRAAKVEKQAKEVSVQQCMQLANDQQLSQEDRAHYQDLLHLAKAGAQRVHSITWSPGSLTDELFSEQGSGLMVTKEPSQIIRPATSADIGPILALLSPLEASGALVRRDRKQLEKEISQFQVVEAEGLVIGTGALMQGEKTAEIAALCLHSDYRKRGLAARLIKTLEQRAKTLGYDSIFTLTTQSVSWFEEQGYQRIELSQLQADRQQTYNYHRNSVILSKRIAS